MDWEEPKAQPKATIAVGEPLDPLGVAELEARLEALRTEISRVEAEIARKKRHALAASAIFGN